MNIFLSLSGLFGVKIAYLGVTPPVLNIEEAAGPPALGVNPFYTAISTATCVDVIAPSLLSKNSRSACYALNTSANSGLISSS